MACQAARQPTYDGGGLMARSVWSPGWYSSRPRPHGDNARGLPGTSGMTCCLHQPMTDSHTRRIGSRGQVNVTDALGELKSITKSGITTSLTYDSWGRTTGAA